MNRVPRSLSVRHLRLTLAGVSPLFVTAALFAQAAPAAKPAEEITVLEKFIAAESALAKSGDLMPTSRPSDSVFGDSKSILEIPRSVTVLTPELMQKFGVRDFGDLARVTAGGERPNYYGVPGTPILRGDFAGTFYNGMQRAFQRNEMPTSFGSLEGMDIVKGPAPGNYGPTQGGGFVNFLPKSPYYDKFRGSVRTTVGSYDYFNTQVDVGGPFLMGKRPAAFRVSLTNQNAESYYDNVKNDFISLYGALKSYLTPNLALFTGAEYYKFKSNENAGWNRVTQDLIDHGNYIVGEVPNLTSAAGNGFVLPSAIPFVALFGAANPGGSVADNTGGGIIAPAAYVATLTPALRALLSPRGEYTSAFFNAGGKALTVNLDGSKVLADPSDFANSQNFFYFADLVHTGAAKTVLKNQFILDWIKTEKISSYGYAFYMKQVILEDKVSATHRMSGLLSTITYGGSLRHSYAHQLQDFAAEPFSRRDIAQSQIASNSIVLTGPQRPAIGDTRNLWAQGADTELNQLALFGVGELKVSDTFSTIFSLRAEGASFKSKVPNEYERNARRGQQTAKGGKNYYMVSLNPIFRVTPTMSLYASGQYGTALNPSQGGNVGAETNFGETGLMEGGVKVSLIDNTLYATLAGYYSTLSRFNNITNNPYGLRTKGVELETTWLVTKSFSIIANGGLRETIQTSNPGFRFAATQDYYLPMLAGSLYVDFGDNNGLRQKNNPHKIFPGSPQGVANIFATFDFGGGFSLAAGPTFRGSYWHNFEHTLRLPSTMVWNANAGFKRGPIEILLQVTNVFSEDYFYGSDPTFAANTVITKAPPVEAKLNLIYKF